MRKTAEMPEIHIASINDMLTEFDSTFRTAEAHGTGALRKYSLTMEAFDNNPQIELIEYWNYTNELIVIIGDVFKSKKQSREINSSWKQ